MLRLSCACAWVLMWFLPCCVGCLCIAAPPPHQPQKATWPRTYFLSQNNYKWGTAHVDCWMISIITGGCYTCRHLKWQLSCCHNLLKIHYDPNSSHPWFPATCFCKFVMKHMGIWILFPNCRSLVCRCYLVYKITMCGAGLIDEIWDVCVAPAWFLVFHHLSSKCLHYTM